MSIRKRYFVVEVDADEVAKKAAKSKWYARVVIQANSASEEVASAASGILLNSFSLYETQDPEFDKWILKQKALHALTK